MHVVVTGVNGFVGKHLTEELLSHGHTVSGIILPGTPPLDTIPCVSHDIALFIVLCYWFGFVLCIAWY